MSEKKLYSDRRWNDPPQATVIGHRELTEEEKRQADLSLERLFKREGIMRPDESKEDWIREGKVLVGEDAKKYLNL